MSVMNQRSPSATISAPVQLSLPATHFLQFPKPSLSPLVTIEAFLPILSLVLGDRLG